MANSLERIIPEQMDKESVADRQTLELHLYRYAFAAAHLKPGVVADVACGVGYGSYFLSSHHREKIEKIIAADISEESITYAGKHYGKPEIQFIVHDAYTFDPGILFDTVISLETIEHLERPSVFVKHMVSLLKPGGRFIASAPVTPSMDANPWHLNDFTVKTFKNLFIDAGLKEITSEIQLQRYNPFTVTGNKNNEHRPVRKNLFGYYLKHPAKFFLRIKSVFMDGFKNKYLVVVFEKD